LNFTLSNSSANVLQACQRKFAHQYVCKNKKDPDYVDPLYFAFGRAFHECLDAFDHDYRKFNRDVFFSICKQKHQLAYDSVAKIEACLRRYFANFSSDRYEIVGKEVKFVGKILQGVVDLVLREREGERWWISDVKTVGIALEPREIKKAKLVKDQQIGIYTAFALDIAPYCGVDPQYFQGFLYREIEKPRVRIKSGETYDQFNLRCGTPAGREIVLVRDEIDANAAYENFLKIHQIAMETFALVEKEGIESTVQDMKNCVQFGSPCPWFSQCYGKTYSQSKKGEAVSESIISFL